MTEITAGSGQAHTVAAAEGLAVARASLIPIGGVPIDKPFKAEVELGRRYAPDEDVPDGVPVVHKLNFYPGVLTADRRPHNHPWEVIEFTVHKGWYVHRVYDADLTGAYRDVTVSATESGPARYTMLGSEVHMIIDLDRRGVVTEMRCFGHRPFNEFGDRWSNYEVDENGCLVAVGAKDPTFFGSFKALNQPAF